MQDLLLLLLLGLVGADASDDGTGRAGAGAADSQMVAAAQMFGNRLAAVNGGYYLVPGPGRFTALLFCLLS